MVSTANLLYNHLPEVDETKESIKHKYIRDVDCKSAKEVFDSQRLPSFPILDDKLNPSDVTDAYLDDYVMVGLSDGSIIIISLSQKKVLKTWKPFEHMVTTVKILDDLALVCSESGHVVYNLKDFPLSDESQTEPTIV
jgi:hypothetical protein